jgi:integrase
MPPERKPRPLVWTPERTAEFWADQAQLAEAGHGADRFKVWRDAAYRPGPVMVWTPLQAGAFLDYAAAAGDRLSALFETVAATGIRRAEACGLRWADVDLAAGVITIIGTRIAMGREVREETPKSGAGRRDIALDAATAAVLRSPPGAPGC